MPVGAAFNVTVETGGLVKRHTVTTASRTGNRTDIDDPASNGRPDAIVVVTHNWGGFSGLVLEPGDGTGGASGDVIVFSPPSPNIYNPHSVGTWYNRSTGRWSIFNEDDAELPLGMVFNYKVGGSAFVHRATPANISGFLTYIDHPQLNDRPGAILQVTHNRNPGGNGDLRNDSPVAVWYDSSRGRWTIFNERQIPIKPDVAFNVLIVR
jgi:hypothetical protein